MTSTAKPKPISEAEFTAQVLQLAKIVGWRTAHFRPARTATGWRTAVQGDGKGWLDLFMIREKTIIVAELKRNKNQKTTPEQDEWLAAWRLAGIATFVWTPEDFEEIERVLTAPALP